MRVTQNTYTRLFVQQSSTTRSTIADLQEQIATGIRLKKPSDDPLGTGKTVHLEKTLSELDQYKRNGDYTDSRLMMEEAALSGVSEKLTALREVAIRTNNDTLSAQDYKIYLQDVTSAREDIMSYLNSQGPNGEYLFSGTQRDVEPLADDGSYQGNLANQTIRIGVNSTLSVGTAATDVMQYTTTTGDTEIFTTISEIHGLIENASNDNKPVDYHDNMAAIIESLDDAHTQVVSLQANVGHRLTQLDNVRNDNEDVKLMISSDLNDVQGVDYAEAISKLESEILSLEAMQSTYAKLNSLSLFKYVS